jgi:hypothetical protein
MPPHPSSIVRHCSKCTLRRVDALRTLLQVTRGTICRADISCSHVATGPSPSSRCYHRCLARLRPRGCASTTTMVHSNTQMRWASLRRPWTALLSLLGEPRPPGRSKSPAKQHSTHKPCRLAVLRTLLSSCSRGAATANPWRRCTPLSCPFAVAGQRRCPQPSLGRLRSHPNPSPSTAANEHSDAGARRTSFSCPWTSQLSLLGCADQHHSRSHAAPFCLDKPRSPDPFDTLRIPRMPLDGIVVSSAAWIASSHPTSIARQCSKHALQCVHALHVPQLPLDGAAIFAMAEFPPVHSNSIAEQHSTRKPRPLQTLCLPRLPLDGTAVSITYWISSGHTRSIAKRCSKWALQCLAQRGCAAHPSIAPGRRC